MEPVNPTSKLKPVLDEHFKFKIGDVVSYAWHISTLEAERDVNEPFTIPKYAAIRVGVPSSMLVVGRLVEECHGGIQTHYRLRGRIGKDDREALVTHHEFELVAFDDAVALIKSMKPTVVDE